MSLRVGVFISHPIQYYSPLWKRLANLSGLSLRVHYFNDHSIRGGLDKEFNVKVAWDVPLLEGYDHSFITRRADLSRPLSVTLKDAPGLLRDGQFDWVMIIGYTYRFELQIIRTARRLGVPILIRGDMNDAKPYKSVWYRRLLRDRFLKWLYPQIDHFCYIGVNARRHLLRLGVNEGKLFFSPFSVNSDLFEEQYRQLDREALRRGMSIHPQQMVLLFSGKLMPHKAPLVLLEAIASLKNRERLSLIMLGDGVLRDQVESLGRKVLGDRLKLPGFVNQTELGRYFRAADVFVLPSVHDSWGLVVNEAMHFRLPVLVSSSVGCVPDLVREGETGRTFPVGDAKELANHLQEFLDAPDRVRRMGAAAGEHIRGYSIEASAAGITQALSLKA